MMLNFDLILKTQNKKEIWDVFVPCHSSLDLVNVYSQLLVVSVFPLMNSEADYL